MGFWYELKLMGFCLFLFRMVIDLLFLKLLFLFGGIVIILIGGLLCFDVDDIGVFCVVFFWVMLSFEFLMFSLMILVGEVGVVVLKDGDNGEFGEVLGRCEGVFMLIVMCLDVNVEGGLVLRLRGFCLGVVGIVEMVGLELIFMVELFFKVVVGILLVVGEGGDDIIVFIDWFWEILLREVW